MPFRFLFAAVPALLAPLGAETEIERPEPRSAEERIHRAASAATLHAPPGPGALPGGGSDRGADAPRLPLSAGHPPLPRAVRKATAPAGTHREPGRQHLSRCGHGSLRLDLPPPPLG